MATQTSASAPTNAPANAHVAASTNANTPAPTPASAAASAPASAPAPTPASAPAPAATPAPAPQASSKNKPVPHALDMPDEEILYDLADLFKIFSDTTRVKILFALTTGEMSVNDLSDAVTLSQSAVSHQLRILKQTHLVRFRRDGKQIIYSLSDDHVHTMLSQGMTHICE